MNAARATQLLRDAREGSGDAARELIPLVYDELRRIAGGFLRRERRDHTLEPTALVNEAYLRVIDQDAARWEDQQHFLAVAATAMRQVLVDHARRRRAKKRGGSWLKVTLGGLETPGGAQGAIDVLALDEALSRLAELDERKSRVVELRFFAGLKMDEVATALGTSLRTVEADWYFARAWLRAELRDFDPGE